MLKFSLPFVAVLFKLVDTSVVESLIHPLVVTFVELDDSVPELNKGFDRILKLQ